jgi:hypothetical protein
MLEILGAAILVMLVLLVRIWRRIDAEASSRRRQAAAAPAQRPRPARPR